MISLIYAQSSNGVIGRDGGLPWHITSDLKRFKALTMGKPVVMGRKTWDSLPRKPLPGRINIVVTRQGEFSAPGAVVVSSPQEAIQAVSGADEICIIGGAEIYRQFLPLADRIYLTLVNLHVDGDAMAPELNHGEWQPISTEDHPRGPNDDADFVLKTLQRKRN